MAAPIGFVYILGNEYMPDVYKVGFTERAPHQRAADLSGSTGVPAPFKVLCFIEVVDAQAVERAAHHHLARFRINDAREFFHHGLSYAVGYLWWHQRRLSFCEPLARGEMSMLDDPDLLGGQGFATFDKLPDPWAPRLTIAEKGAAASVGFDDDSDYPFGKLQEAPVDTGRTEDDQFVASPALEAALSKAGL